MEHAHTNPAVPIDDNAALALVLDPAIPPQDLATRMGLSLFQLAKWAREHAQQLADLREFFATRAALIASQLHLASLAALDRVIKLADTKDDKAIERTRKAASTILRNLKPPSTPSARNPAAAEPSATSRPQQHASAAPHDHSHAPIAPSSAPTQPLAPMPAPIRPLPRKHRTAADVARLLEALAPPLSAPLAKTA